MCKIIVSDMAQNVTLTLPAIVHLWSSMIIYMCDISHLFYQFQFENDVEYCWRLAKSTYQVSQIQGSRGEVEKKKQLVYASKDLSQKAVALDEQCSNAHKW